MRARTAAVAAAGAAMLFAGCGGDPPPVDTATTASATAEPPAATDARAQLAARAAAAKDRRYAALYTLSAPQRPDRTVVVTRADDGGWRVDIPGGAVGGTADVAVARIADGLYQCALPSAENFVSASCVRVADPDGQVPGDADPGVQHVFVDWLDVFTDRRSALAVSTAKRLPGVRGACFSVETNSASLAAPVDAGIYCFDVEGNLTGARLGFGTLTLTGQPAPAPPTVALPGPVVDGDPLPMASPPPTTPPASAESAGPLVRPMDALAD